jgi:uncharacterized protein YkwD
LLAASRIKQEDAFTESKSMPMRHSSRRLRASAIVAIAGAALMAGYPGAAAGFPRHASRLHATMSARHAGARHRKGPLGSVASTCNAANTPVDSTTAQAIRAAVVCLLNNERTSLGLRPLRENRRLDRAAQSWSATMVSTQQFSHGDLAARISAVGYDWFTAGENIASGFATASSVVRAWIASPEHCRNILDPTFTSIGSGTVDQAIPQVATTGSTWTVEFAAPFGARQSSDWGPANSHC